MPHEVEIGVLVLTSKPDILVKIEGSDLRVIPVVLRILHPIPSSI